MKKILLGILLLALLIAAPVPAMARVDVGISISLPPLQFFVGPPEVVVIPETNVYFVPDLDEDIYFYNGWWWRPWEGRWYRSRDYRSGWAYYQSVPSFYRRMPSDWRNDYRERRWRGHEWNYQPIPHREVQKNWRTWEKNKHWEKQNSWGVPALQRRTPSRQRSREVTQPNRAREEQQQRPRQQSHEAPPQRSREVQEQRQQPQPHEAARPQRSRGNESQRSESRQGKPERGERERNDRR